MSASRRRRGAAAGGKSEEAGAPRLTVVAVRDQMVAEIAQLRQENIEMAKAVTAAVFGHAQGAGAATAPGSGPVCRRRGGWAGGASPGAAVPAAGGTAASTDSETFANLLSQGRRRSGQATGEGARRWQADDDSLAKNPTWRPNFEDSILRDKWLSAHMLPPRALAALGYLELVRSLGVVYFLLRFGWA